MRRRNIVKERKGVKNKRLGKSKAWLSERTEEGGEKGGKKEESKGRGSGKKERKMGDQLH